MSKQKQPRFEVVRSDAGWFARVRGSNGRKIFQSEVYTRKAAALNAFRVLGDLFGRTPSKISGSGALCVALCWHEYDNGVTEAGMSVVPIRSIDERGSGA